MIERLATGEWFTARISACGLYSAVYKRTSPQIATQLRTQFRQLCNDDTPMVRRSAAINLGEMASCLDLDTLRSEFLPVLTTIIQVRCTSGCSYCILYLTSFVHQRPCVSTPVYFPVASPSVFYYCFKRAVSKIGVTFVGNIYFKKPREI